MNDRTNDRNRAIELVFSHMGLDRNDTLHNQASVIETCLDEGCQTFIVTVLQFEYDHANAISRHTLTRYAVHEVDYFWTYKMLDTLSLSDADLLDGEFRYVDREHDDDIETGTVVWDRSVDPAADPIMTKDEP